MRKIRIYPRGYKAENSEAGKYAKSDRHVNDIAAKRLRELTGEKCGNYVGPAAIRPSDLLLFSAEPSP